MEWQISETLQNDTRSMATLLLSSLSWDLGSKIMSCSTSLDFSFSTTLGRSRWSSESCNLWCRQTYSSEQLHRRNGARPRRCAAFCRLKYFFLSSSSKAFKWNVCWACLFLNSLSFNSWKASWVFSRSSQKSIWIVLVLRDQEGCTLNSYLRV